MGAKDIFQSKRGPFLAPGGGERVEGEFGGEGGLKGEQCHRNGNIEF